MKKNGFVFVLLVILCFVFFGCYTLAPNTERVSDSRGSNPNSDSRFYEIKGANCTDSWIVGDDADKDKAKVEIQGDSIVLSSPADCRAAAMAAYSFGSFQSRRAKVIINYGGISSGSDHCVGYMTATYAGDKKAGFSLELRSDLGTMMLPLEDPTLFIGSNGTLLVHVGAGSGQNLTIKSIRVEYTDEEPQAVRCRYDYEDQFPSSYHYNSWHAYYDGPVYSYSSSYSYTSSNGSYSYSYTVYRNWGSSSYYTIYSSSFSNYDAYYYHSNYSSSYYVREDHVAYVPKIHTQKARYWGEKNGYRKRDKDSRSVLFFRNREKIEAVNGNQNKEEIKGGVALAVVGGKNQAANTKNRKRKVENRPEAGNGTVSLDGREIKAAPNSSQGFTRIKQSSDKKNEVVDQNEARQGPSIMERALDRLFSIGDKTRRETSRVQSSSPQYQSAPAVNLNVNGYRTDQSNNSQRKVEKKLPPEKVQRTLTPVVKTEQKTSSQNNDDEKKKQEEENQKKRRVIK